MAGLFGKIGSAIGGVSGAIGLGTGLLQTGIGLLERRKARKERDAAESFLEANKYQIPEGAMASLSTAERLAQSPTLPAEDLIRSRLAATTAGGVGALQGAATSASDVQAGLANLFGQQMMAEQDIGISAAQQFVENQRQLQRAQEMMAGYEDLEWQQNVLAPYQQRMERAGQYSQRGAQGIGMGLQGLAGTGAGIMQQKGAEKRFGEYMDYLRG